MEDTGKIPITVGIIGSPDIVVTHKHRIQIEDLFRDLASAYPHSPFCLFSTLTSDVDRFTANLFMNLKASNEKYKEKFELFIPLTLDDRRFDDTDKEARELLKKAKRKFYILSDDKKSDQSHLNYDLLKFVADNSLILIALWDGSDEKGGISDIINYKRFGDENDVAKSTFEYEGNVFIMPCDRVNGEISGIAKNSEINLSLIQVLEDSTIRQALDKIEEINTDSLKIDNDTLIKSQNNLIGNREELLDSQKSILNIYSVLDILSLHYHKRYNSTIIWLFITGLFIIMSFGIYTNLWLNEITLTIAIALILLAGVIYFYSQVTKDLTKYIYNRTLAEALRIQFYWNVAGINSNVSDHILRIHRKEFVWIEHILSSVYGTTYNNSPITNAIVNDLTINWVKRQADFFDSSIKKMTQKMAEYQMISNFSFIAAAALLLSIFFLDKFYIQNNWMNYLQVIIGTLLGIFALIRGYIQIKGYSQLLNQYELMNVLYQKAETKINKIITTSAETQIKLEYLKELFFIIGKESLIENGTWYLILKEKEPGIEGI